MYQRALQGYKKALGQEAVMTYVPSLNTCQNLANLFERRGKLVEAEELYHRTLRGIEKVFGTSSQRYKRISEALDRMHYSV